MENNYVSWYLYESFILARIFIKNFTQSVLFSLKTLQFSSRLISQIRMLLFIIAGIIVADNSLPVVCFCVKSFVLFNVFIMKVILALSGRFGVAVINTTKKRGSFKWEL